MKLYSVGRVLTSGLTTPPGIIEWEIAKQSQEGYWVRVHGRPKATEFISMHLIGSSYFLEYQEVMKELRDIIRQKKRSAEREVKFWASLYAHAKAGRAYIKPWTAGSRRTEDKPRRAGTLGGEA